MSDALLSSLGSLMVGGIFIVAGFKKIVDPIPTAAVIKRTKFYEGAVRYGIPLDKGNHLNNFTVALGTSLAVAGMLFTFNIRRRFATGYLSALLAAFTAFVYIDLDKPATTSDENKIQAAKNVALMGAMWMATYGKAPTTTVVVTPAVSPNAKVVKEQPLPIA